MDKEISRGCPQGSCSGPGLWNLHYNSLLELKYIKRTKVVAFAADLIIATRGESVRTVENVNVELSKVNVWAKNNKTRFNDKKSKVMLVSRRKRKENKKITVYLNNKPLDQVTKMKYLGIILDHKFRFNENIKYTAERCGKLIHSIARAAKMTRRIKHAAMDTIYKGAILPLLTYGAPGWIEAMNHEYNRRKYSTEVQRLVNTGMAKAYRTTSTEALCMLTATPIIIKLEEIVKGYNTRKRKSNSLMKVDHKVEYK